MKIVFLGIILLVVSEAIGQKVIDRPRVGAKTTETRAISRIELTDTATILYVDARYRPRWWIKVESEEYICRSGEDEKLKLRSAEGITVDKPYFMPASGQYSFKLTFPPLPEGTTQMDWMLGEKEGLFNIALTDQPEKSLFPEALKGNWLSENGIWKYTFEERIAFADGDFWEYGPVKTKGLKTEFHLKKGDREMRVYAHRDKAGKMKIGKSEKKLSPYIQKKPQQLLTGIGKGMVKPLLKKDTAVLKGYIKGYAPQVGKQQGIFYVDNVMSGRQESFPVTISEDGRFEFKAEMYYPQPVYLRFPYRINPSIFIGPGDTTFVCLDMAQYIDPYREADEVEMREKTSLFAGAYAQVNDELQKCRIFLQLDYQDLQKRSKGQTLEEFKQGILEKEKEALQKLEVYKKQNGLSKAGEQVLTWKFKLGCCNAILDYDYFLEKNWREKNEKIKPEDQVPFTKPVLGAEFYDFVRELNLGDESPVIAGGDFETTINRIKFSDPLRGKQKGSIEGLDMEAELQKRGAVFTKPEKEFFALMRQFQKMENPDTAQVRKADEKYKDIAQGLSEKYSRQLQEIVDQYLQKEQSRILKEYFGLEPGFVTEVMELQDQLQGLAQNFQIMTEQELQEAGKAYTHPFLKSYLVDCNNQLKLKLEVNKNKKGYTVHPIPEVENEKLFEAIISPFKGKIVFVDFWATWCPPCREGIQKMKFVKEELAGQEIEFVYITGETSPLKTYENMIPDIKGHHFRLSSEQWKYICKQFHIDGIPHYMVIGKDGKIREEKFNGWQDQIAIKAALLKYCSKKSE